MDRAVTLFTAHKILISSAVALFVLYGTIEARSAIHGVDGAWIRAGLSGLAAGGLAAYLRTVIRRGRI